MAISCLLFTLSSYQNELASKCFWQSAQGYSLRYYINALTLKSTVYIQWPHIPHMFLSFDVLRLHGYGPQSLRHDFLGSCRQFLCDFHVPLRAHLQLNFVLIWPSNLQLCGLKANRVSSVLFFFSVFPSLNLKPFKGTCQPFH